jgi:xanthine dehydrogenase accessory factor
MVVGRCGVLGTIGGGRMEAEVIALARDTLESGRTRVHAFDLSGADAADSQMICGGTCEAAP